MTLDSAVMNWLRRLPEAPVTSALVVANLGIYVWILWVSGMMSGFDFGTMTYFGANVVGTGQDASHWRWVTAAFVHFNPVHIAACLWALGLAGVIAERAVGPGVVAAAYVLTGALGNALSSGINAWRHHYAQSAGASGAILGLVGMAAVFAWRTGQKGIASSLAVSVGIVLVLGYFLDLDNAAHLGGFLSGALIGLVRARRPQRLPRWLDGAFVAAAAACTVAAFAIIRGYHGTH
jgi:rhomboid protease GluP